MKTENTVAKLLLNAVWEEDITKADVAIEMGADPNWVFNGYPIIMHAIFTRNKEMTMLLIEKGALQLEEALGFALDRGIGEMIPFLAFLGIVPKEMEEKAYFGPYPSRYAPLSA